MRAIIARASYPSIGIIFHACSGRTLELLDITVDAGIDGDGEKDKDSGLRFGEPLCELRVNNLVLRKRGAYLTQDRPKAVMSCLAKAVLKWTSLVSWLCYPRLPVSDPDLWDGSGNCDHRIPTLRPLSSIHAYMAWISHNTPLDISNSRCTYSYITITTGDQTL